MSSTIKKAITQRRKLQLRSAHGSRIVEPYAFGLDMEGRPLLLCFEYGAQEHASCSCYWRLVYLDELVSIEMLEEAFGRNQSGYVRNHPAFHTVLIQV
jgi:hypothetical protein